MSGVFQVDREIFDHGIWNNIAEFRIFLYILGKAVWKEEGIKVGNVNIARGQYLRSYRKLREDLMYIENNTVEHYSISQIHRIVKRFVEDGRITTEETELGTLFTVVNYSLYQGFDRFQRDNQEQQKNGEGTAEEQQRNNKNKDNKDKKDNNTSSCEDDQVKKEPQLKFPEGSKEYKLADFLRRWITKNNPKTKVPDDKKIDSWSQQIDYMIRLDKRDPEDIKTVIEFSQKDSFWMTNILSASKLRKQFDQLYLKSKQGNKQQNKQAKKLKTNFHLERSRGDNYSADELEKLVLDNQKRNRERR